MEVERPRYRSSTAGAPKSIRRSPSSTASSSEVVESEANDVRRDKTKFDQSAGLSGTVDVERLKNAADQAAGIQARSRSPTLAATGLDADSAALRVPRDSVTQCVGENRRRTSRSVGGQSWVLRRRGTR